MVFAPSVGATPAGFVGDGRPARSRGYLRLLIAT